MADGNVPRFLVVDDDTASVKGLSQLLIFDGHDVASFSRGADAIETLAREGFDVVVADLEMPRVDGHAVVQAARAHQPGACIVVATVRAHEAYDPLVCAGVCIVAEKPLEYAEMMKHVVECRARGGPGLHGRCDMRSRQYGHQLVPLRRG